ncbi:MAG: hypothetical protein ACXW4U_00910, partial [Anaerolineales bacterium]
MNPYFADILSQPTALRQVITQFPHSAINQIQKEINEREFDQIIMTGMGASYAAAYPAFIQLAGTSIPA